MAVIARERAHGESFRGGGYVVKGEEYFGRLAANALKVLSSSPFPLSAREIADLAGLKLTEVYAALGWLAREGRVEIIHSGRRTLFRLYLLPFWYRLAASAMVRGASLEVKGVSKRFGKVVALDNVHLKVSPGELFTILGPSGCGKTTLLRIIAGLEEPDEGEVYIDGRSMRRVPPYERGTGMVFQDLALFPHMTVRENVAFGLEVRGVPREVIEERVARVLELVRLPLPEYGDRYVHQLSGGAAAEGRSR